MLGGTWVLDTGHFPRPASCFSEELYPEPSREGFAAGTAPYGLLLDFVEWTFVDRWGYLSAKPVAPLRDTDSLDRAVWDELVRTSKALRQRLATNALVFERRTWRDDLALWDDELLPSLLEGHRRLQAVDPSGLDDDDLLAHLDRCRANLRRAVYVHHRFDVTPVLPVGDLLVQAGAWTGASASELLGLLHGAGPLSVGAGSELSLMADAIRGDGAARSALDSNADPPEELLAALCSMPGPVGETSARYVEIVGHWSSGTGLDVSEASLGEMPGLLVESVRMAVAGGRADDGGRVADQSAAELRSTVPAGDRAAFDELLAEARLVHRLRDERALSCDVWANGLMRRGILTAGERLAGRGRVEHPAHLVESTWSEMRSLIEKGDGPPPDVLAERARYREQAVADDQPVFLGDPPRTAVPLEWLEPGVVRTERALRTYLAAMSGPADEPGPVSSTVRGQAASPGVYEGRARVVEGSESFARLHEGDVLVTVATSPAFNIVLPLVGAVVTDRGGLLSHAAIVAREYGIPAVVGCGDATARLAEGALVRVDGTAGEVTLLGT